MTSTNHFIFQQATLPIHKFVRPSTAEGGAIIDFYFLSNGKEPFHIQSYSERKCGHVERKYESLVLFRSLCAYPAGIYHLKVNNRNTITRCEICSKLTIKISDWDIACFLLEPIKEDLSPKTHACFYGII